MDATRGNQTYDEISRVYKAITGDPSQGTFGYIGDTGIFPANLMDLVQKPASNPQYSRAALE